MILCAHLFKNCNSLTPTEQEKIDATSMIDEDNDPENSSKERNIDLKLKNKEIQFFK